MHSDAAHSRTSREQDLCSPAGHSVANGGEAWRTAQQDAHSTPPLSGESQSLDCATPTAQKRRAQSLPSVYIAGPYRGPTESAIRRNIERAREAAELVWKCGGKALCPHLNTAFMGGVVPDAVFLRADLEWLAQCDAVYAVHGWEQSVGAKGEIAEARRLGITVINDELVLRHWLYNWCKREKVP